MLFYFLKRAALTVPTFFALMFLTFVAIRLVPGDPVEVRVGERGISPERLAQFRHELGPRPADLESSSSITCGRCCTAISAPPS